MSQLARKQATAEPKATPVEGGAVGAEESRDGGGAEEDAGKVQRQELLQAESAARLASLQSRLAALEGAQKKGKEVTVEAEVVAAVEEEEEEEEEDAETRTCRRVFHGLVFFLSREVPRESLLLVIRAFGGTASWDGDGAPFSEDSDAITHQVLIRANPSPSLWATAGGRQCDVPAQPSPSLCCQVVDRPSQKHRHLSREYVQPQWVYDCSNARMLLPTTPYGPGL